MSATQSRVEFMRADPSHDAAIRELLRERPMTGDVQISLQREPSYFASLAAEGGDHYPIVALDGSRVVCIGNVAVRMRYVNGRARRVGYLGQLRLAASHAGRADVILRGYRFFRSLQPMTGAELLFTSIAIDNRRATRLLERGVRDMPRYRRIGELATLTFPTDRPLALKPAPARAAGAAAHAADTGRFQLQPAADSPDLGNHLAIVDGGRVVASASFWDQRPFKQTVVCGYSPRLRRSRWVYNAISRLRHGIVLPPAGTPLAHAYVTQVAVRDDQYFLPLVTTLMSRAAASGIGLLTIGFDAGDDRAHALARHCRAWTYRSRLYLVGWPEDSSKCEPLDGRPLQPEVALL